MAVVEEPERRIVEVIGGQQGTVGEGRTVERLVVPAFDVPRARAPGPWSREDGGWWPRARALPTEVAPGTGSSVDCI
jgi:hypothetical protein